MSKVSPNSELSIVPYNKYIFPLTVVKPMKSATNINKPYLPNELLELILHDPYAVDTIGTIHVTNISYYKVSGEAEHEYLVLQVEDDQGRFRNYLKLDRCPQPGQELPAPRVWLGPEKNWLDIVQEDQPIETPEETRSG
ncbi:hypothetical protein RSOL_536440, partial [Rhizoctonia solani AG-3 Rhs1AP]